MRNIAKQLTLLVLVSSFVVLAAGPIVGRAQSANYPNQRITFVIGFAAGGFADTIGR
jgi:tripartite-type tricarboxylate transporter receptor subunit TctC